MGLLEVKEKAESLVWFLKRPELYPQLFVMLGQKLSGGEPDTSRESAAWCEAQAVEMNEALSQVMGSGPRKPVRELFPEVFSGAEARAKDCPVKMGGGGALDALYYLAEHVKAKSVIETGVAYGWSSLALLLSLRNRAEAKLISTDMPYLKMGNDQWVGCVVPESLRGAWEIKRLPDRQGLPPALAKFPELDMCHYDSDKSYRGRMWAYPKLWKKLRAGGIFLSDDVGDNFAFRDFVREMGMKPIIFRLPHSSGVQYVGLVVKGRQ